MVTCALLNFSSMMSILTWKRAAMLTGLMILPTRGASIYSRQSNTSAISWFPCPDSDTTQCAIFDVPLDYTNPNNGATVSIFLRKFPATAPEDQRLGSLLTNPGGPGGSGSRWIAEAGEEVSTLVDGRYDIIGFDPRAVNLTGPPTACHDVEAKFVHREYQLAMHGPPFPHVGGAGERAHVAKLAAIQAGHNAACEKNGNHKMLKNSGTVAVVKDMERIMQALGEDGLNYLGYSYGTILGATFAAMRPDMVKRMVLDGVSNSESYFDDILQFGRDAMQDTHKVISGFITECVEAGPPGCALALTQDNKTETAEGLTKRIDALYNRFEQEPLVIGDLPAGTGIIQAHSVQYLILNSMYAPVSWTALARMLLDLEQGDGSSLYTALFGAIYQYLTPRPYDQNVFNRSMQMSGSREGLYPILCGDSQQSNLNITVDEYANYFRELGGLNSVGEQWALLAGGCRGWSFQAKERYTGPWTVEKGLKKTKFPILFVSLDADPVTPLPSAIKMSRGFGNESASLLVQKGYGHCSTAHPSLCTVKNIHDYFVEGKVPVNGTHCTPEPNWIFPSSNLTNSKRSTLSKRDNKLLDAVEKIGRTRSKFMGGF
ncbi:unnamed protein product [Rhizoctonia solani]|uniref:Uncharacterized protein n=1 Tax=Rhizoctonia solani TaxID=456999 RepID=A0A8H2X3C3_9AGAM|nr:unnamed protein product [Rhizoctonia solani]